MTNSAGPRPKRRVTSRCGTSVCPHAAQRSLDAGDRDDEESPVRGNFDDRAREDDAFEIDDSEIVIVKFLHRMDRHGRVQRTDQIAEPVNSSLGHISIVSEYSLGA